MNYQQTLLEAYQSLFNEGHVPEWAVRKKSNPEEFVPPAIPFVGKNYDDLKVLVYASAENLTYYNSYHEYLDNNQFAFIRSKYFFDKKNSFFPYVHIEPVNNGSLVLVTGYILNKLKNIHFSSPIELADKVAFANFGKFSIETKGENIDYANDYSFLEPSIPYVKKDLETLKPTIVIIPKTIYNHKPIKKIFDELIPSAKIFPIYQITRTTINCHIKKKYPPKPKSELPDWLVEWHEKLDTFSNKKTRISGKTKENFYSIYSYLDDILKNINT